MSAVGLGAIPEETKLGILPSYDFFEKRTICNQSLNGHTESLYPINGIQESNAGPIRFLIKGTSDYINFDKTYLFIRGKFKGKLPKAGATAELVDIGDASEPKFSWVNLLPHAIFESVNITLNNTTITMGDQHYAIRAYVQTVLNSNPATLDTYGLMSGWFKDEGEWDSISFNKNKALEKRRERANKELECVFAIDICSPLFQMEKLLISNIDVEISLAKRTNAAYYMMHDIDGNCAFEIKDAVLRVRKVTPVPEIQASVEQYLMHKGPLTYILDDPRVVPISVQQGERHIYKQYLTVGHHPKRLVILMVDSLAYTGQANRNPFRFQHFDLKQVILKKDGLEYPTPPIMTDFTNENYIDAYRHFLQSIQADKNPFVPCLTEKDFANGMFMLSWDMSPDQYGADNPQALGEHNADISLSMDFAKALPMPITLLVYYQLEMRMTVNQARQVIVETL